MTYPLRSGRLVLIRKYYIAICVSKINEALLKSRVGVALALDTDFMSINRKHDHFHVFRAAMEGLHCCAWVFGYNKVEQLDKCATLA